MPLTRFDPMAALVVIDLQKGVTGMPTVHPMEAIVGRTAQLARAFRERRLPVALVNVTGMAPGRTDAGRPTFSLPPDWTELAPELEQKPDDCLVSKQRWGAFIGTTLHDDLQKRGVTQIFLTGVATGAGVESTARSAYDYGYNVAGDRRGDGPGCGHAPALLREDLSEARGNRYHREHIKVVGIQAAVLASAVWVGGGRRDCAAARACGRWRDERLRNGLLSMYRESLVTKIGSNRLLPRRRSC